MAGHSQFKNIMYRKGAQDARRARLFNRLTREITSAIQATGQSDPGMNPRLRTAIQNARSQNMPNDRIKRAIGGASDEGVRYVEVRYEGYGAGGVALIVEALTDNRNRTTAVVRSVFNRYGGSLGGTNSVSFLFERVGRIVYIGDVEMRDRVFEAALEAGAHDINVTEEGCEVITIADDFTRIRDVLEGSFGVPSQASFGWSPYTTICPSESDAELVLKLLGALDENEDVQNVESNVDIPKDLLDRLTG